MGIETVTRKNILRIMIYLLLSTMLAAFCLRYDYFIDAFNKINSTYSVKDRVVELQSKIDPILKSDFEKAGLIYPPVEVTLLFIKDEKALYLYGGTTSNDMKFVKKYKVLAASGKLGPKLKEGDRQVPEGIYKVESLNPNSFFHLALRVSYPNQDDLDFAKAENRTNLGSDIMIHGSNASVGCIAIGDDKIEEIFYLAATTNFSKWNIILSPTDFRKKEAFSYSYNLNNLYNKIKYNMVSLPSIGL